MSPGLSKKCPKEDRVHPVRRNAILSIVANRWKADAGTAQHPPPFRRQSPFGGFLIDSEAYSKELMDRPGDGFEYLFDERSLLPYGEKHLS